MKLSGKSNLHRALFKGNVCFVERDLLGIPYKLIPYKGGTGKKQKHPFHKNRQKRRWVNGREIAGAGTINTYTVPIRPKSRCQFCTKNYADLDEKFRVAKNMSKTALWPPVFIVLKISHFNTPPQTYFSRSIWYQNSLCISH